MTDYKLPIARIDGEPVVLPDVQAHTFTCCECGLTHMVVYELHGNEITFRAYRDGYMTQKERKRRGVSIRHRK